jgi:hypothetical protein
MKMLFDELAQLNRRFDEQDEHWTRHFNGLEQSISEHSKVTVRRINALEASHSSAVGACGSATPRCHGPHRHP